MPGPVGIPAVDSSATVPLFIGCIFTWFLSGSLLVQIYDYFCTDQLKGDVTFVKYAVWAAFILDLLRSMSVTSVAWQGLVTAWGNSSGFFETSVFSAMAVPLTGFEAGLVQVFFAWRIWSLKRDSKVARLVALIISLMALTQLVSAIVRGVNCYKYVNHHLGLYGVENSARVWLSATLLCDFIIVSTMTYLLLQAKFECSFKSTKRVLFRLIIMTLETGALTLVATLIQLIFYLRFPMDVRQQVSVMYILGGLYSNVLLAVLNGRKRVRCRLGEASQNSLNFHFTEQSVAGNNPSGSPSVSCSGELEARGNLNAKEV